MFLEEWGNKSEVEVCDPLCTCKSEHDSRTALECPASLENTLEIPLVQPPGAVESTACGVPLAKHNPECIVCKDLGIQPGQVSRQELVDFIRAICEGSPVVSSNKVQGQRAIELAAWDFYRRLQEAHEL